MGFLSKGRSNFRPPGAEESQATWAAIGRGPEPLKNDDLQSFIGFYALKQIVFGASDTRQQSGLKLGRPPQRPRADAYLSGSTGKPAFPSRPGDPAATARSGGDGRRADSRSHAQRSEHG